MVRIRAVDWLRGLVIVLMTVDHAGSMLDAAHMHGDSAATWIVGSPLPFGEFMTRWITHLCAPTFVLLSGVSLSLSTEKRRRRGERGQTGFIVTRGLIIAALDPLWMSLAFTHYEPMLLQVLYAIGVSMVCMAWLRRLPSPVLIAVALFVLGAAELSLRWAPVLQPWRALWRFTLGAGPPFAGAAVICAYPLLPWLSVMMLGWVLGRWLLKPGSNGARAHTTAVAGAALLAVFVVVRGIDGYGNWALHRDGPELLRWLHVSKYPPSLSFMSLELGLGMLLLAMFMALDDPARPRRALWALSLLGSTSFFYYLLHVHLLYSAVLVFGIDRSTHGLAKTWIGMAVTLLVLAGPCVRFRRYKNAHPDGWARYV